MSNRIDAFLQLGRDQGASDIHLAVGSPPLLRMIGELVPIRYRDLSADELSALVREVMDESHKLKFDEGHDVDFSYAPVKASAIGSTSIARWVAWARPSV